MSANISDHLNRQQELTGFQVAFLEADDAVMQRYPRGLTRMTLDFFRNTTLIEKGFDSGSDRSRAGASIHPIKAKRAVKVRQYGFRALFADPDHGRWLREGKWRVV